MNFRDQATLKVSSGAEVSVADSGALRFDNFAASFAQGTRLTAKTPGLIEVKNSSSLTASADVLLNGNALSDRLTQNAIKTSGAASFVKIINLTAGNLISNVRELLGGAEAFKDNAKLHGEGSIEVASGTHDIKEGFDTLKLSKVTADGAGTRVDFETNDSYVTLGQGKISGKGLVRVQNNSALNMAKGAFEVTSGGRLELEDTGALSLDNGSTASFAAGTQFQSAAGSKFELKGGSSLTADAGVFLDGAALKAGVASGSLKASGSGTWVKLLNLNWQNVSQNVRELLGGQITSGAKLYGEGAIEVDSGAHEVKAGFDTLTVKNLSAAGAGTSVNFDSGSSYVALQKGSISGGELRVRQGAKVNVTNGGSVGFKDGTLSVEDGGTLVFDQASASFDESSRISAGTADSVLVNHGSALLAHSSVFLNGSKLQDGLAAKAVHADGAGSYVKLLHLSESSLLDDIKGLMGGAEAFTHQAKLLGEFDLSASSGEHVIKGGGLDGLAVPELKVSGADTKVSIDSGATAITITQAEVDGGALEVAEGSSVSVQKGGSVAVKSGTLAVKDGGALKLDGALTLAGADAAAQFAQGAGLALGQGSKVAVKDGAALEADAGVLLNGGALKADLASGTLEIGQGSLLKVQNPDAAELGADLRSLIAMDQGSKLEAQADTLEVSDGQGYSVSGGYDKIALGTLKLEGAGSALKFADKDLSIGAAAIGGGAASDFGGRTAVSGDVSVADGARATFAGPAEIKGDLSVSGADSSVRIESSDSVVSGGINVTDGADLAADYKVFFNDNRTALNDHVSQDALNIGSGSTLNLLNMGQVSLESAQGMRSILGLGDEATLGVEIQSAKELGVQLLTDEINTVAAAGITNTALHTLTADTSSKPLSEQFKEAGLPEGAKVKLSDVQLTSGDSARIGAMSVVLAPDKASDGAVPNFISGQDGEAASAELSEGSRLVLSGDGRIKNILSSDGKGILEVTGRAEAERIGSRERPLLKALISGDLKAGEVHLKDSEISGTLNAKAAELADSEIAGVLKAKKASLKDAAVSEKDTGGRVLEATEAELEDSELSGEVTAENASAGGELAGSGALDVSGTLTLTSDTNVTLSSDASILGGASVSAKTTDLAGHTLFLDPVWEEGASVLTTGLISGDQSDTLNGSLIAGQNSAFYIGDVEGGTELFKSEVKKLSKTGVTALGFIDKAITVKSGSGITVNGALTSPDDTSAAAANTVTVAKNSKLILSSSSSQVPPCPQARR